MTTRCHLDIWFERAGHSVAVGVSVIAAFLLRFDFSIPHDVAPVLKQAVICALFVKLPLFDLVGFYRSLRRFASIKDLHRVFLANLGGSAIFAIVSALWIGPAMPRSVWLIDGLLCFLITSLLKFYERIRDESYFHERAKEPRKGTLIYGAGVAGAELLREIQSNRNTGYDVQGFLDDEQNKQGASIRGVSVLGSGREAPAIVQRLNSHKNSIEEIIIAIPSATGQQMREVLANCRAANLPCKTIPGIEELLRGTVLSAQVRNVSVLDLLGRQQVRLDERPVRASLAGRSILVTGAAGSIGSELCRQLARFDPARLVAFDQAESDLFSLENELRDRFPHLEFVAALGDIREPDRLAEVMQEQKIESVFHAAAYKHVPMMEAHTLEAVRNNILGTWNLVRAAHRQNVRTLLMISSDKAVKPSCVMGATKRICEKLVAARGFGGSKGVSVRFGNVLGSSGSVVPIFQAQIASGGPVKITHPEARRYFMTVGEAVSLVIQASTNSQGGEIFVLEMGEPIRIVDLAENMIRLAGLIPYDDIDIHFTGLRPGEKLIEEIIGDENLSTSYQEKIRIIREPPLDWDLAVAWTEELERLLKARVEGQIKAHIRTLVPEYAARAPLEQTLGEKAANGLIHPSRPLIVRDKPGLGGRTNGKSKETASTEELAPSIS